MKSFSRELRKDIVKECLSKQLQLPDATCTAREDSRLEGAMGRHDGAEWEKGKWYSML